MENNINQKANHIKKGDFMEIEGKIIVYRTCYKIKKCNGTRFIGFSEMNPELAQFIDDVKGEKLSFNDVVLSPNLTLALRNENEDIINYILNPSNFSKILKYSLSDAFIEEDRFYYMSEHCAAVLSYPCAPLQEQLSDDDGFSRFLLRFFSTTASSNPFLCANFVKVYTSYLTYTRGALLEDTQDILPQIIIKLNIISFVQLLNFIVSSFFSCINDGDEFFSQLGQAIRHSEAHCQGAQSVISSYLQATDSESFHDSSIDFSDLTQSLFVAANKESFSSYVKAQSLVLIIKIYERNTALYSQIIQQHEGDFNFDDVSTLTPALFKLYPSKCIERITYLFKYPLYTFLCKVIVNTIIETGLEIINGIITKESIIHLINDHFHDDSNNVNGHILRLCRYFVTKKENLPSLNCEEWNTLESQFLLEKIRLMKENYGGFTGETPDPDEILFNSTNAPSIHTTTIKSIAPGGFNFDSSDDE